MNTHDKIELPPLPEGWETELLDWVSACQSAYHIDNTPGHRFGGLGSNLEENRLEIVCFVRGLIESHAATLQSQDKEDAARFKFLRDNAQLFTHFGDIGNSGWCVMRRDHTITRVFTYNGKELAEAIDHARRNEGDGE